MKIRRVIRYEDKVYDSILRLLPQLDGSAEPPSKEYFKEMIDSENIFFFVAEAESSEIAGMLTLVKYPNITGRKLWIEDVVVDSSFRGKGAGEQLTLEALGYARSLGAAEIKLTSRPFREAANQLYLKIGFERYETNVYKYKLT